VTDVKLAYFVSRFPHLYQTFVRREINELVRQGSKIDVFPVTGPRRGGARDDVNARSDAAVAIMPASLREFSTWVRALRAIRRHFGPCIDLVWQLLLATHGHPANLAKSLMAFVKGLAWSDAIEKRGTTHLHAHWSTYPATAAMVVSRLTGTPFSFAFHAYDIFATRIMIPEKIERAAFVVVNCRYTLDYILQQIPGTDPGKLVLVYNSLDLAKYENPTHTPDPTRPLILAIGQLVPTKGFMDLVDACSLLAAEGREFRLLFAGSGPIQNTLASKARESGISDRVELAGEKTEEQVRNLLAQATMLVMPCITPKKGTHDALPNVIIEALASGVPVVATNVFGIPEVVEHEKTGLLVPERDPASLRDAMVRLLSDPALADRLASEGKRRAAEWFDARKNGQQLLGLFQRGTG